MAPVDTNAKAIFDGITEYVLDHPSTGESRLHAAEQSYQLQLQHNGARLAPQMASMGIAMAHLIAHQRGGSAVTYNYLHLATTRIAGIKASLISPAAWPELVTDALGMSDHPPATRETRRGPAHRAAL